MDTPVSTITERSTAEFLPQETTGKIRKGGFRAAMFLFWMTGLENIGFLAFMVSSVLYFLGSMHFDLSGICKHSYKLHWINLLAYNTRRVYSRYICLKAKHHPNFWMCRDIRIHSSHNSSTLRQSAADALCLTCKVEGGNAALFYISLSLFALGTGCVRGSGPSLGADQFDKDHPEERKQLGSFFNWLLLSITLGACIGVTVIVWVATKKSWALSFFISMLLAIVGFIVVYLGKPFYRGRVPGESPIIKVTQVIVVAIRNRNLPMPDSSDELYQFTDKAGRYIQEKISHTNQFRLLDKAAVLPQGTTPEPWKVCSVTQVEEVKILVRMLPILLSTVLMNTALAQLQTFSVQQGIIMDLKLGSFQVPPASIPIIPFIFMSILVPTYEIIFVPLARRITGHPTGITHLQRVGVGLVLSAISMTVAGLIEVKRKNAFNNEGRLISAFWLSYHYAIFGIADMFTFVGLLEFFYSEAAVGMRSLSASFSYLTISLGYFLSSVIVSIVEDVTKKVTPSKKGWLEGIDLNKNHLELFYWFLAILSVLNFFVYLACTRWYQYRKEDHEWKVGEELADRSVIA